MSKPKRGKDLVKRKRGKLIFLLLLSAVTFFILQSFTSWYISLGILILLITSFKIIQVKRRGYFWNDKFGNHLSFKEFLKSWKRGVQGITPLQQSKMNLMGIWITITGVVSGIVVNLLVRMKNIWWWVTIILIGSLILTLVQMLSIYQKYCKHKEVEKMMKELEKKK